MLKYYEQNVKEVLNNNNVLYIKPCKMKNKNALCAVKLVSTGKYERLVLTKPLSRSLFPNSPIINLYNKYDENNFNYLISVANNYCAINKKMLAGFLYKDNSTYENFVNIYAVFSDSSCTCIGVDKKDIFNKITKKEYEDILTKDRISKLKSTKAFIIERYFDNDEAIIPELIKKKTLFNWKNI